MRAFVLIAISLTLASCTQAAPRQRVDPLMYGSWTLDVTQSRFGSDGAPTSGIVNWNRNGWAFAITFPGGMYADAVAVREGVCLLVGVPDDTTCRYEIVAPRHVRIILSERGQVRRQGDIELVDDNTERAVHHVTPAHGAPYEEVTVWRRVS